MYSEVIAEKAKDIWSKFFERPTVILPFLYGEMAWSFLTEVSLLDHSSTHRYLDNFKQLEFCEVLVVPRSMNMKMFSLVESQLSKLEKRPLIVCLGICQEKNLYDSYAFERNIVEKLKVDIVIEGDIGQFTELLDKHFTSNQVSENV